MTQAVKDPVTKRFTYAHELPPEVLEAAAVNSDCPELPEELTEWEPEAPADPEDKYPDWTAETTRVISGPIGLVAGYPGTRVANWHEGAAHAKAWCAERKLRLYKYWTVPGRWFARVERRA